MEACGCSCGSIWISIETELDNKPPELGGFLFLPLETGRLRIKGEGNAVQLECLSINCHNGRNTNHFKAEINCYHTRISSSREFSLRHNVPIEQSISNDMQLKSVS